MPFKKSQHYVFKRCRLKAEYETVSSVTTSLTSRVLRQKPKDKNDCEYIQQILEEKTPASNSGRALADILSLSEKDNLGEYQVSKVTNAWGKTTVQYYREQDVSQYELLNRIQANEERLKEENEDMKKRITDLERDREIMLQWQTLSNVIDVMNTFIWEAYLDSRRQELVDLEIKTFSDLHHAARFSLVDHKRACAQSAVNDVEKGVYNIAVALLEKKKLVRDDRTRVAHPSVSQDRILECITSIFPEAASRTPSQERFFQYIRAVLAEQS